jgi:peptidyl-dipeptidase Dcp
MNNTNPLLQKFSGFDACVPFDQIKIEHYKPALEESIKIAKKNIEALKNNPAEPNFENVIVALETSSERMGLVGTIFSNLDTANGNDEMMKLAPEMYQLSAAFSSDVALDPELFKKIKAVHDKRDKLNLTTEQKTLLDKTYKSFVRNGALLDEATKEKIRAIDQELAGLTPKFSENVLKSTNAFELWIDNHADLAGLPDSAIEAAAMAAQKKNQQNDKKGQWLFTLQFPSYLPFVTYAKNRSLREKISKAAASKAFHDQFDNQANVKRIVELKFERANLLGYKNHAEFVLQERMARDPQTVMQFLKRLTEAGKSAGVRDLQEVIAFAKSTDNLTDIQPWDFAYYSEKLKESKYAFNEEDLRPYFKLENVVQGVFEHAKKLYGLTFKENKSIPVYHPEVKAYEIFEEKTNRYMGLFYTDFFPRETKKSGAWMTSFRDQGLHDDQVKRPHVAIVCNFTRPTATKPSLLTYDEVRTLFHEFGHALHGMLADGTYPSVTGTSVYWDFVELPSQIMENWVTQKEGLDVFAKHFETNQPIPHELVEKLKRAQKFQTGWMMMRQLQFATLDMAWYSTDPKKISDVDTFETQATESTRLFPKIPGTNVSCAFSHIFAGGYSAGYYSYKWAEVLDADAFEYFLEKGIFNAEVAQKFKEHILSKGGSEHPMELYKKFRGREPDPNALLRRDGLI